MSQPTTVRLHVEGMMCQRNCGSTVEAALKAVPGVVDAKASFATSSAWATLVAGSTTQPSDVVEAVEDVGFDARLKTTTKIYCQVEGMMCQRNCGTTVRNVLLQVGGVMQAESSFVYSQAWAEVPVELDTPSMQEELVDAIECVGFDAALISEEDALMQQKQKQQEEAAKDTTKSDTLVTTPLDDSYSSNPGAIVLSVEGMSCAVCTGKVERCLMKVSGVSAAFVSLATHRAEVTPNPDDDAEAVAMLSQKAIQKLGYPCKILSAGQGSPMTLQENVKTLEDAKHSELKAWRNLLILAVVLLVPMLWLKRKMSHMMTDPGNSNMIDDFDHHDAAPAVPNSPMTRDYHLDNCMGQYMLVMAILSTLMQTLVGYRYYKAAWNAGTNFGMDFLVVLGTTSSYVYSVGVWMWLLVGSHTNVAPDDSPLEPTFGTGAMLLTFVTFGKFLEAYAKGKTSSALEALMKLQPQWASRIVEGLEGWEDTTLKQASDEEDEETDGGEKVPQAVNLASLETEEVETYSINVGEYVRVLPGSRIPADGVIVALSTNSPHAPKSLDDGPSSTAQTVAYIDESAFSGEPFPVAKSVGDSVYGSSVNQLSVLVIRVTATGANSVLAKIVQLMEEAQRNKAPIQALADQIASVFAPVVMGLALSTFLMWVLLNGEAPAEERLFLAFLSAISVIVVACPCALGLATPTAVMVGTGVGATHGLLIKGGSVLEEMQSVDTMVFDKTGTLTTGKAVLGAHKELVQDPKDPLLQFLPTKVMSSGKRGDHNLALWLAACAENQSEHPLARAIVNAAKSLWGGDVACSHEGVEVEDFVVVPGSGVECVVSKPQWGSYTVRVGSKQWTQEPVACSTRQLTPDDATGDKEVTEWRQQGQIGFYVSVLNLAADEGPLDLLAASTLVPQRATSQQRRVVGVLGVVDPLREQAKSTIAALKGQGVDVFLLTGDHELTARAVARQVGIDQDKVCAGVKPDEKASYVADLQEQKGSTRRVGFVGDGINDSVALANANVGVAIGAGTEVAVEAADVVLVRSNLHDVVIALHLSKVVFRRIRMNFVWAMAYNLVALPFAAGILYPFTKFQLPPEYAGLMMAFSSVSVVTSSLLLRNYKRPQIHENGTLEGGSGVLQRMMHCCDRKPQYASVQTALYSDDDELELV